MDAPGSPETIILAHLTFHEPIAAQDIEAGVRAFLKTPHVAILDHVGLVVADWDLAVIDGTPELTMAFRGLGATDGGAMVRTVRRFLRGLWSAIHRPQALSPDEADVPWEDRIGRWCISSAAAPVMDFGPAWREAVRPPGGPEEDRLVLWVSGDPARLRGVETAGHASGPADVRPPRQERDACVQCATEPGDRLFLAVCLSLGVAPPALQLAIRMLLVDGPGAAVAATLSTLDRPPYTWSTYWDPRAHAVAVVADVTHADYAAVFSALPPAIARMTRRRVSPSTAQYALEAVRRLQQQVDRSLFRQTWWLQRGLPPLQGDHDVTGEAFRSALDQRLRETALRLLVVQSLGGWRRKLGGLPDGERE